jgi:hypothetical protein
MADETPLEEKDPRLQTCHVALMDIFEFKQIIETGQLDD